jgi:hypothetical protein
MSACGTVRRTVETSGPAKTCLVLATSDAVLHVRSEMAMNADATGTAE